MIEDFFTISIRNIVGKGVRSWLTMVGIFMGIAAIVSLISLGEGLQNAIDEQFELLGYNIIYVMPGSSLISMGTSTAKLDDHDLKIIKRIRGVELAGGLISKLAKVKYKDEVKYSWVSGVEPGDTEEIFFDGTGIEILKGQARFSESDRYKAVVGYEFWVGNVFDRPVGVGDRITINDKKFDVVAEVSRIGNTQDDMNVYIPQETAKDIFGVEDDYMVIMARTKSNYEVGDVAEDITKALRRDRGLDEGDEDFEVQTMEQIKESVGIVLSGVHLVVIGISLISLFVGGIGIMNTMYTSVLEKTQEIGVMKAVGAKNSDISLLFMIESGTIGMVGGIIGCLIGAGLSKGVEYIAVVELDQTMIKASITPELIIGALAFSFIVGCISGVLPARQAAQLKPVDALRYE
ncbi:MAG: ABC transporter permease [Candidatus Altiarchaeota archaeon]|nr:ABC transporter permease [Candidatus Altiarchaeota archaeon]